MAVTAYWYAPAFIKAFNKEIDFDTDTQKVAATTNTYTPNQDTHDYFNDVTNEITDTGYTAGGATLSAGKAVTNTLNVVKIDATDPTAWTSANPGSITARRFPVYESTGVSTTSALLVWIDNGADAVASNGGTLSIVFNASGIATITATDATGFP